MVNEQYMDRLERWAEKVLDESAQLPEELPADELREHEVTWYADFYTLGDGWLIAGPDDPAMRRWLTEDEGMSPEFADEILNKMKELAGARSAV
jgi:hypothetical protein